MKNGKTEDHKKITIYRLKIQTWQAAFKTAYNAIPCYGGLV